MKIIVADDEPLQLETILEYVSEIYPTAELEGFTKVSDVLKYMETNRADVAILDIQMPGNINGIQLGELLRQNNQEIKLLYCTSYSDYAINAFSIHANGYLCKPVQKEVLKKELQYVLQMPAFGNEEKPYIHTFGNFDIFVDNRPVVFRRSKSKEILAYLVDREGAWVTNQELIVVLWAESDADLTLSKYVTTLVNDMMLALSGAGAAHIVERQRGKLRVLTKAVECDYYGYLSGSSGACARFTGEYMSQYSWGEETLATIMRHLKHI